MDWIKGMKQRFPRNGPGLSGRCSLFQIVEIRRHYVWPHKTLILSGQTIWTTIWDIICPTYDIKCYI